MDTMDGLFTDPENVDDLFVKDEPEDDGHLRLEFTANGQTETFRLADRVGIMPLMQFARIARSGARTGDMGAMAAMLDFIQQAIHDDDWDAFVQFSTDVRAEADELLTFVRSAMSAISARPTRPRSSSQGGSRTTHESSPEDSTFTVSSPLVKRPGPIMQDPRVLEFKALAAAV